MDCANRRALFHRRQQFVERFLEQSHTINLQFIPDIAHINADLLQREVIVLRLFDTGNKAGAGFAVITEQADGDIG